MTGTLCIRYQQPLIWSLAILVLTLLESTIVAGLGLRLHVAVVGLIGGLGTLEPLGPITLAVAGAAAAAGFSRLRSLSGRALVALEPTALLAVHPRNRTGRPPHPGSPRSGPDPRLARLHHPP